MKELIKSVLLRLALLGGMIGMFMLGQEQGYGAHRIEMLKKMQQCSQNIAMPPGDYEDEMFADIVYSLLLLDCYERELLKRGS